MFCSRVNCVKRKLDLIWTHIHRLWLFVLRGGGGGGVITRSIGLSVYFWRNWCYYIIPIYKLRECYIRLDCGVPQCFAITGYLEPHMSQWYLYNWELKLFVILKEYCRPQRLIINRYLPAAKKECTSSSCHNAGARIESPDLKLWQIIKSRYGHWKRDALKYTFNFRGINNKLRINNLVG